MNNFTSPKKQSRSYTILSVITIALMIFLNGFFAQPLIAAHGGGGGGGGSGGGGGGGEEETILGNNLSVPTIFVAGSTAPTTRIPCPSLAISPGTDGKTPSTEYPGYWLQKTDATWTAECTTTESANVTADWGDNLTGEHGVTGNHTIRVEVGLLDMEAIMTGYTVENLTPSLDDRNSTYGTLGDPQAVFTTGADIFAKVWDPGATLKIEKMNGPTPASTIYDGPMSSEINSTGSVVYGYNWGNKGSPPGTGIFRLTFTTSPATLITGVADTSAEFTEHSSSLLVNLTDGSDPNEAPSIVSIIPTSGPDTGGTFVTISGTGFVDGAEITIDNVNATDVNFINDATITAVTPAHAAGTHDVTIINPDSQFATLPLAFSFITPTSSGGGGGGGSSSSSSTRINNQGLVLGTKTWLNGLLLKTNDHPVVYMVRNNILHPFSSENMFLAYRFRFSDIQIISTDDLRNSTIGQIAGYPDGSLLKGSGPTVYVVFGNTKQSISSMQAFNRFQFRIQNIIRVQDSELGNYGNGPAIQ